MSASRKAWLTAALLAMAPAIADEPPEMALLEYLGSWEGTDEDWVLLTEEQDDSRANMDETRSDPAAEAEASQETEHEG